MAGAVVMPRLGWSGETGTLIEWLKQDGEAVKAGDVICTVEGEKATIEVEALDSGILQIPDDSPPPGTAVPVGTRLAYIVAPDRPAPTGTGAAAPIIAQSFTSDSASSLQDSPATSDVAMRPEQAARLSQPRISPLARRLTKELGVTWSSLQGSGRTGRIVARDIRQAYSQQAGAAVTGDVAPAVSAALARRAGVASPAAAPAPAPFVGVDSPERGMAPSQEQRPDAASAAASEQPRRVPLSPVRRLTARRLRESSATVVPVTLTTDADATDLVRLRELIKVDAQGSALPVPSYDDLLIRIVALALGDHPDLNASLEGDVLVRHAAVHVGLAVDTERGLLVPVIRDAERKSLQHIARESFGLIQQVRDGTLPAAAMQGGTFTITNLGPYAIDAFTPIINLPECAILGIGRIQARPVVVDEASEQVAVRKMLALSLTFDHRAVDGAPAARFLQQVRRFIERPTLWLVR